MKEVALGDYVFAEVVGRVDDPLEIWNDREAR